MLRRRGCLPVFFVSYVGSVPKPSIPFNPVLSGHGPALESGGFLGWASKLLCVSLQAFPAVWNLERVPGNQTGLDNVLGTVIGVPTCKTACEVNLWGSLTKGLARDGGLENWSQLYLG